MARAHAAATAPLEADWFGEHAPFNTVRQLAAALPAAPAEGPLLLPLPAPTDDGIADAEDDDPDELAAAFEVVQPRERDAAPEPPAVKEIATPALSVPTWSVRLPGVDPLPQRMQGRTGWSLHNSIRILRRAEDVTLHLRHEAVVTAFDSASRAIRGER